MINAIVRDHDPPTGEQSQLSGEECLSASQAQDTQLWQCVASFSAVLRYVAGCAVGSCASGGSADACIR